MREDANHEKDFFAWSVRQASLLRQGDYEEADIRRIADEIELMGKSERRELKSRLKVLLKHLLKWEYQPQKRSKSWINTIQSQREDLEEVLEDNPSLEREIPEFIDVAYRKAKREAETETGLEIFPEENPFDFEKAMRKTPE